MKIRQFSLALITALNIGLNVSTKADAPNFNGGYVAAAAGANGMTTKVIFQDPTPEAISVDYGHTNVVGSIATGMHWNVSPGILGFNVFADFGNNIAELSVTDPAATVSINLKQKESYGISLEPGFELEKSTMAYLKLSYIQSKFDIEFTVSGLGSASEEKTYTGFGYGVGLKQLINSNLFAFTEWQEADYVTKDTDTKSVTVNVKPKNTVGLLGLGWQF